MALAGFVVRSPRAYWSHYARGWVHDLMDATFYHSREAATRQLNLLRRRGERVVIEPVTCPCDA